MHLIKLFPLLLLSLLFNTAVASDADVRIVLHVNDGFKLGHLRNSVSNIRRELGQEVDIKVVVNGKAVTRMLRSNKESTKIINSVLEQNVEVGLCHNAVNNNEIDRALLISGLEVLETDGNVTLIKYMQQGYLYIKL